LYAECGGLFLDDVEEFVLANGAEHEVALVLVLAQKGQEVFEGVCDTSARVAMVN
jgi:hypothetical protein